MLKDRRKNMAQNLPCFSRVLNSLDARSSRYGHPKLACCVKMVSRGACSRSISNFDARQGILRNHCKSEDLRSPAKSVAKTRQFLHPEVNGPGRCSRMCPASQMPTFRRGFRKRGRGLARFWRNKRVARSRREAVGSIEDHIPSHVQDCPGGVHFGDSYIKRSGSDWFVHVCTLKTWVGWSPWFACSGHLTNPESP